MVDFVFYENEYNRLVRPFDNVTGLTEISTELKILQLNMVNTTWIYRIDPESIDQKIGPSYSYFKINKTTRKDVVLCLNIFIENRLIFLSTFRQNLWHYQEKLNLNKKFFEVKFRERLIVFNSSCFNFQKNTKNSFIKHNFQKHKKKHKLLFEYRRILTTSQGVIYQKNGLYILIFLIYYPLH